MLSAITENRIIKTIKNVVSNRYFPFVTALVTVACYYLNLDVVTFYYLAVTGIFMIIFLDNLIPLITNFLFVNVTISYDHAPTTFGASNGSDYLLQPAVLSQLLVLLVLFVGALVFRMTVTVRQKKFKLTPEFIGLSVLAVAFFLNGMFSADYDPMNMLYGAFMGCCFLGIFAVMKDNVVCDEKSFEDLAYAFVALSVLLILELGIKYATVEVISNGKIIRGHLGFGWGMYNNMGMLMMLCLPSVMYIAGKHKFGYLFFIYAIIHSAATIMTMSRQAIVCIAVIFPLCLVLLLVKGKNRLINSIITGVCVLVLAIFAGVYWDEFLKLFSGLLQDNLSNGNGRMELWKTAWKNFLSAPVFGTGFYVDLANDPGFAGLSVIPDMYHNTLFQLIGSCGIFGLGAYAVHRVQTVVSFCKDVTLPRTFIAITILTLLIVNLLDNHLFYISPTVVYSCLLAVLIKSRNPNRVYKKFTKKADGKDTADVNQTNN